MRRRGRGGRGCGCAPGRYQRLNRRLWPWRSSNRDLRQGVVTVTGRAAATILTQTVATNLLIASNRDRSHRTCGCNAVAYTNSCMRVTIAVTVVIGVVVGVVTALVLMCVKGCIARSVGGRVRRRQDGRRRAGLAQPCGGDAGPPHGVK